jgi:hypothetical protein
MTRDEMFDPSQEVRSESECVVGARKCDVSRDVLLES